MNINITCNEATITPNSFRTFDVQLNEVDPDSILDEFAVEDIVRHFEHSQLLDAIGEDSCKDHFGLETEE